MILWNLKLLTVKHNAIENWQILSCMEPETRRTWNDSMKDKQQAGLRRERDGVKVIDCGRHTSMYVKYVCEMVNW